VCHISLTDKNKQSKKIRLENKAHVLKRKHIQQIKQLSIMAENLLKALQMATTNTQSALLPAF
jgi:hypothetical protein